MSVGPRIDRYAWRAMIRVRRARSASRTKLHREVVGGSRKLLGEVDESATGSTKLWSMGQLRASASTRRTASASGSGISEPAASANARQAWAGLCEWLVSPETP